MAAEYQVEKVSTGGWGNFTLSYASPNRGIHLLKTEGGVGWQYAQGQQLAQGLALLEERTTEEESMNHGSLSLSLSL